jgi:hypothetical protein
MSSTNLAKEAGLVSNVNPETGIRYGVISAHSVPWLQDEIITHGESITYRNYVSELQDRIRYAPTQEDGNLSDVLEDYYLGDRAKDDILESAQEHEGAWTEEDIEELTQSVLDAISCLEFDEEEYEYEDEESRFLLGFLGGGPMIWVLKSPVITNVRLCSPCAPGAGDLDSPDDDGYACYAVSEEWFDEDNPCPYPTWAAIEAEVINI